MVTNTSFLSRIAIATGFLLLLWAPACGDEETVPEPTTVTLTLLVQSHSASCAPNWSPHTWYGLFRRLPFAHSVDLALRDGSLQLQPIAGVRVALDRPDGERLGEEDSDADGLVVFEIPGEMWPEDVAMSATAHKDGFLMHTLAGIPRPASAEPLSLTIHPHWKDPGEMVRVSGTALNRHPNGTLFVISTVPCGGYLNADSDSWQFEVPVGVPFDLIAVEFAASYISTWDYDIQYLHWARVSSDALEEDTVLDIDFAADAEEPTAFAGSFTLPERAESLLQGPTGWPNVVVLLRGSYWSPDVGWPARARRRGGIVEYTGERLELPEFGGYWYHYFVEPVDGQPAFGFSTAWGRGLPEGEQPQLLDQPDWINESPSGQGHPIDEPLSWEISDEGVRPSVYISGGDDVVWTVELPQDATSATLPAPPSNVDLAELLGDSPRAIVALERPIDSDDGVFLLASWGTERPLDLGE